LTRKEVAGGKKRTGSLKKSIKKSITKISKKTKKGLALTILKMKYGGED